MWEVFYFNIDLLKSLTGDCMIADLSESYEQNKREYTEEERIKLRQMRSSSMLYRFFDGIRNFFKPVYNIIMPVNNFVNKLTHRVEENTEHLAFRTTVMVLLRCLIAVAIKDTAFFDYLMELDLNGTFAKVLFGQVFVLASFEYSDKYDKGHKYYIDLFFSGAVHLLMFYYLY